MSPTDQRLVALADGSMVPALAFGTGTALYSRDDVSALIATAIQTGITHLDTSELYKNEASVGKGIAASGASRSSLFVTTKFAELVAVPSGSVAEGVKAKLQHQLRELQLEYIDLYLWHTPVGFEGQIAEIWKGFELVKKEGLAKHVGVSNFRVRDLEEILNSNPEILPEINQIEFHPYVLKAAQPIIDLQSRYNIKFASYGGATPIFRVPDGPVSAVLPPIASRLGQESGQLVTPGQVLLGWIWKKGGIAVTTSSKRERMEEYLKAQTLPELTEAEVMEIDRAGGQLHSRQFTTHMDR